MADVAVNRRDGDANSPVPGGNFYYTDPDGVLRRADGAFFEASTGTGLALRTANFQSRPVVLNRPFHSVAEMGYAFRDTPWKSLNFFTPESGDAALLTESEALAAALTNGVFSPASDIAIKRRHESVLRALVDSAQVRTWNLLIDVVTQTGRFSQSVGGDLSRFIVEGERRYWVHVAIDRLTGEVIFKDIELVMDQ